MVNDKQSVKYKESFDPAMIIPNIIKGGGITALGGVGFLGIKQITEQTLNTYGWNIVSTGSNEALALGTHGGLFLAAVLTVASSGHGINKGIQIVAAAGVAGAFFYAAATDKLNFNGPALLEQEPIIQSMTEIPVPHPIAGATITFG